MTINLYNTLTKRVEHFAPQNPEHVTMYVCGPTVYNFVHIGNARGPVVFGLLADVLRRRYGKVVYARNITDVDDKINAAAKERGVEISEITDVFTQFYLEDMERLGVQAPDIQPRATDNIQPIIRMVQLLVESGFAYEVEGHVLFAVDEKSDYGKLSRRSVDDMRSSGRIEPAPFKRNPADFVLWKPSTADLPGWESPWGRGRPGWHIECSAMAAEHLGETIDIHAGGVDLTFPHHENEIAQSEAAHGRDFAKYWLHNGMLNIDGGSMSKSKGNTVTVNELLKQYPAEALRYALLTGHYRQPLDWSDTLVEQSIRTLDRLYATLRDLSDVEVEPETPEDVLDALEDDLNTPQALAELAHVALAARRSVGRERKRAKALLLGGGKLLGLFTMTPEAWFSRGMENDQEIETLVKERDAAKQRRDYRTADILRSKLSDMGIVLEDTSNGTRWIRKAFQ